MTLDEEKKKTITKQHKNMSDEDWIANMPEHHLKGY